MESVESDTIDSYWFSFNRTGWRTIDSVLSAIARAGKAYHSTESWNEPDGETPSHRDLIQHAACQAAEEVKLLCKERDDLSEALAEETAKVVNAHRENARLREGHQRMNRMLSNLWTFMVRESLIDEKLAEEAGPANDHESRGRLNIVEVAERVMLQLREAWRAARDNR